METATRDRGLAAFFAHRAEAITFWASIGGLLVLVLITAANLATRRATPPAVTELEARIEYLEARLDSLQTR